jgi:hypothetical protein
MRPFSWNLSFTALLALSLATGVAFAQQPVARQYTVATLPAASANNGIVAQIKDGLNANDCSTGGGAMIVFCVSNGTSWGGLSVGAASASTLILNNAGTTGTTVNKLAKTTGAPSTAVISATTDTGGILGVVIGGAGTSGSATIETYGIVAVAFDGATVAGDYVTISATTAGAAHDFGATYPSAGQQVLGKVLTTNASAGTYQMYLYPTEVHGYITNAASRLTGSASITPSALTDGACSLLGTTLTITGAVVGDPVSVGANPSLATGVEPRAKVTSANTVSIELCNFTGASVTPSAATFAATVVH